MEKDYSNLLGRRFFKHTEDDNLVVYKVISFASMDKARVINIKDPNKTFKIPYEELLNDYNMLTPDGNIVFNSIHNTGLFLLSLILFLVLLVCLWCSPPKLLL